MGHKRFAVQQAVLGWATNHLRDYPWRKKLDNPYAIIVAELLLKRTTAKAASRIYEEFLGEFPSVEKLASATEKEMVQAFSGVGLQWQRARATKKLADYLMEEEDGHIPCDLERLLAVPGLGEYSARAVLSFGCDKPVAVVDVNVERVYSRVFQKTLPEKPTRNFLQSFAEQLLPADQHREYNFGLLDLGGLICRYVDPLCGQCPLNGVCDYYSSRGPKRIRERPAEYITSGPGSKIRKLRREKGIGLVKLAQTSGVSKLTIIKAEAGRTQPTRRTLEKLAGVLGVDVETLLTS